MFLKTLHAQQLLRILYRENRSRQKENEMI